MTPESNASSEIQIEQTIITDLPIETYEEDLFGRIKFAENLAENIHISDTSNSSLTISICAPWGAGKTSFINLLRHKLSEYGENNIIEFNPWFYTNTEQLMQQFLTTVITSTIDPDMEDRYRRLETALSIVSDLTLVFNKNISTLLDNQVKRLTRLPTPKDILRELKKISTNQRSIIIIDDIDRLERDAIENIFKLTRLMSHIDNTIFILSFDHSVVCSKLGQTKEEAQEYIEKIIQIPFDLPIPEQHILEKILLEEINSLHINTHPTEHELEYFHTIWEGGFKTLFQTIRKIKRFSNSMRLIYPTLKNEVNIIDLALVEYLRIEEREVYRNIIKHKIPLLRGEQPKRHEGGQTTSIQEISQLARNNQDIIEKLLTIMFAFALSA